VLDETGQPLRVAINSTIQDQYVASSLDVLNTYQTTGVVLGSGAPIRRNAITDGDTVVLKTVGETTATIHDENLTIRAAEGSDGLTLNLAEAPITPTDTRTTAVNDITLADYAPGEGADVDVNGNGLDNVITGNSGDNRLSGGGGTDTLIGGGGNDVIDGGAGGDTTTFSGARDDYRVTRTGDVFTITDLRDGSTAGVDTVTGVETFTFSDGSRTSANLINGRASLNGTNKSDTFADAAARDTTYSGGNGNDTIDGRDGSDILRGDNGDDRLDGGSGEDQLFGGNGSDRLEGGSGDDLLSGGNGNDVFVFRAGFGDDAVLDFRAGQDRLDFAGMGGDADYAQDGGDTVISFDDGSSIRLVGVDRDDLGFGGGSSSSAFAL